MLEACSEFRVWGFRAYGCKVKGYSSNNLETNGMGHGNRTKGVWLRVRIEGLKELGLGV